MIAVLKKVNLWQFLETQDGLQTKLAEKAGNLANVTKSDCIYFMEDGKVREKGTHGIPEILASAAVVGLHVWKRNTLLSIAVGTVFYMFLVQVVF